MCAMIAVMQRQDLIASVDLRNGFWPAPEAAVTALEAGFESMERALAEDDPRFKQPIVYAVVRRGAEVFVMERLSGGREARLHGACSVGVGGHVDTPFAPEGALIGALRQEWAEEVEADFVPEFRFVGFVNDDSIEVGRVHLGFVYEVQAPPEAELRIRETHKLAGRWMSLAEAVELGERLETWSLFVLRWLCAR